MTSDYTAADKAFREAYAGRPSYAPGDIPDQEIWRTAWQACESHKARSTSTLSIKFEEWKQTVLLTKSEEFAASLAWQACESRHKNEKCPICGGVEGCDHSVLERNRSNDNDYVAWLRYTNKSIVICDSDEPRAFKVYRHTAEERVRSAVAEARQENVQQIKSLMDTRHELINAAVAATKAEMREAALLLPRPWMDAAPLITYEEWEQAVDKILSTDGDPHWLEKQLLDARITEYKKNHGNSVYGGPCKTFGCDGCRYINEMIADRRALDSKA